MFINKTGGAGIVFIDFSNEDPILGVGSSQEFLVTNEIEYKYKYNNIYIYYIRLNTKACAQL